MSSRSLHSEDDAISDRGDQEVASQPTSGAGQPEGAKKRSSGEPEGQPAPRRRR